MNIYSLCKTCAYTCKYIRAILVHMYTYVYPARIHLQRSIYSHLHAHVREKRNTYTNQCIYADLHGISSTKKPETRTKWYWDILTFIINCCILFHISLKFITEFPISDVSAISIYTTHEVILPCQFMLLVCLYTVSPISIWPFTILHPGLRERFQSINVYSFVSLELLEQPGTDNTKTKYSKIVSVSCGRNYVYLNIQECRIKLPTNNTEYIVHTQVVPVHVAVVMRCSFTVKSLI